MINWKVRFKHKGFLTALIALVASFIYQGLALFGITPPIAQQDVLQLASLFLTLLTGLGIIIDPTTQGVGDSKNAMNYQQPKGKRL